MSSDIYSDFWTNFGIWMFHQKPPNVHKFNKYLKLLVSLASSPLLGFWKTQELAFDLSVDLRLAETMHTWNTVRHFGNVPGS